MKSLVLAAIVVAGLAVPGAARTVEERLIAELHSQGYVIVEDGYTFLGRLRIVAKSDKYHREIVVNPGTGEVLRDYAVQIRDPQIPAGTGSDALPAPTTGATVSSGGAVVPAAGTETDAPPDETASRASLGGSGETGAAAPVPSVASEGVPEPESSAEPEDAPDPILSEPALPAEEGAP